MPAYLPDLNPIEKMWSKIKAWLRREAARSIEQLQQAVADAFQHVTAAVCQAYFKTCEYATHE
jgi:transposase